MSEFIEKFYKVYLPKKYNPQDVEKLRFAISYFNNPLIYNPFIHFWMKHAIFSSKEKNIISMPSLDQINDLGFLIGIKEDLELLRKTKLAKNKKEATNSYLKWKIEAEKKKKNYLQII